jgi:hypothetical protein
MKEDLLLVGVLGEEVLLIGLNEGRHVLLVGLCGGRRCS